jgi:hypothetical protein
MCLCLPGGVLTGKYVDGKASKDSRLNFFEGTPHHRLEPSSLSQSSGFCQSQSLTLFSLACRLHGQIQRLAGQGGCSRVLQTGQEIRGHTHTAGPCLVQPEVESCCPLVLCIANYASVWQMSTECLMLCWSNEVNQTSALLGSYVSRVTNFEQVDNDQYNYWRHQDGPAEGVHFEALPIVIGDSIACSFLFVE